MDQIKKKMAALKKETDEAEDKAVRAEAAMKEAETRADNVSMHNYLYL